MNFSGQTFSMKEVADLINIKGFGRNKLFEFLREKGILDSSNRPYRKYIDQGYFIYVFPENRFDEYGRSVLMTLVTETGLDFIKKLIEDHVHEGGKIPIRTKKEKEQENYNSKIRRRRIL